MTRAVPCHITIIPFDTPAAKIALMKPKGLVLSGGPSSVYASDAPLPDKGIFKLGIPVLGICFGVQLLAQFLGGKVEKGQKREYGKGTLTVIDRECALFNGLPAEQPHQRRIDAALTELYEELGLVEAGERSALSEHEA